jgi:hypothetical protein
MPIDKNSPEVLDNSVIPYKGSQLNSVTHVLPGLDETPWYNNPQEISGITGVRNSYNNKISSHIRGYPVTFEIITDRNTQARLSDKNNKPISVKLNASMKSYHVQSSHIVNKAPSRTGVHLTFWGMNADMLSGECSTGLFMNQYGITNFLNIANADDSVKEVIAAAIYPNSSTPASVLVQTDAVSVGPDDLRIAAQDAFVEFLSLFKNNGVTWYHPSGVTDTAPDQASTPASSNYESTFSSKSGINTYEMKARNNDVYTRGYVVMNFRSSSYLGFFKSLSWSMDADNPFRWTFSFVFQVERTLTLLYYPQIVG